MTIHSDIDKIFKEGLSDFSQKPPGFIWGNIEQVLDKKRKKKQNRLFITLAASVALLLSFGAGYLFTGVTDNGKEIADNRPSQMEEPLNTNNGQSQFPVVAHQIKQQTENQSLVQQTLPKKSVKREDHKPKSRSKKGANQVNIADSTIKLANSGGILLPPVFGETLGYESPVIIQHTDSEIEKMEMKYPALNDSRDLVYEYREIPMYPEAEEESEPLFANVWQVGMEATPLVSYRSVGSVSSESLKDADIFTNYEKDYKNEKPLTSYSTGVNVNYLFSERWNLQSGIYMSEIGQISEDVEINWQFTANNEPFYYLNTSVGNVKIYGTQNELVRELSSSKNTEYSVGGVEGFDEIANMSETTTADFVQTYNYIEIPLVVSYKIVDKRIDLNVTGGISTNVMYRSQVYAKENSNEYSLNADYENIKTMSYSGVFGIGFTYPFFTKLFLNLQPTLRYSLSPLNGEGNVYPYSVGIYTGLKYQF